MGESLVRFPIIYLLKELAQTHLHRAGAGILPHPHSKGEDLQTSTFIYYWALAHRDPSSGVQVVNVTEYYDDRDDDSSIWYKSLVPRYRCLQSRDLPAGAKVGFKYQSTTVNPSMFLPWIKKRLDERGVRFVRREVSSIDEARIILGMDVLVNASGLGAYNIAHDEKVHPIRGQTMLVESDLEQMVLFQGSHYTYQIPRMNSGGVIIGGVAQEGNLDPEPDAVSKTDILRRMNLVLPHRFNDIDVDKRVLRDLVGFRPSRKDGYRLEREGDVTHAYGFGSLGYTYCYGVALKVRELVRAADLPRSNL